MSNDIKVPEYLKKVLDSGATADGAELVSAASSVPRISLKGQKFRFIEDGEEVQTVKDEVFVVILGAQPQNGMSKTFYRKKYNPDDSGPPDCSSQDGVRPDYWISNPESSVCATCEQNKWGSATAMSGKKAKACRDSKRLMVILPTEPIEDAKIYILNVTVSSLKALSEYGKVLVQNGVPMASCVTKVIMLDDSDYPQLGFEFAGFLKEDLCIQSLERSKNREWDSFDTKQLAIQDKDSSTGHKPQLGEDESFDDNKPVTQRTNSAPAAQASVNDVLEKWGE